MVSEVGCSFGGVVAVADGSLDSVVVGSLEVLCPVFVVSSTSLASSLG